MDKLEKELGVSFLGNEVASGTEIIERLGNEHLTTKKPIIYTSADSVLQIATLYYILEKTIQQLHPYCQL